MGIVYNRAMSRLLMYVRQTTCPDQALARRCLQELNITPIEVNISREADAAQTLLELVGSMSVPTLVVADDDAQPVTPPDPIERGRSVRNLDRGSIISEPTRDGLRAFLIKHGLLPHDR
jgi:glutaredoxin